VYAPKKELLGLSWRELMYTSFPLWLVVVMNQLVQLAGQFFAGAYLESSLVAQLAVAQRTAMLASFVLIAINFVVAPRFAALYRKNEKEELASLAKKSVTLTSLVALPILGLMFFFPEVIMRLFGNDFASGANLLRVLAVGQFINVVTGSVGFLLSMTGHERDLRNITMLSGSIALVLAWVLTSNFGVMGAATGTAIAVATQNLVAVYYVKKRLGFNTLAVWR
jgi:O-antigen/teichoic acid export membrane protein